MPKTIILAARALGLSALLALAFTSGASAATRHHHRYGYQHTSFHAHAGFHGHARRYGHHAAAGHIRFSRFGGRRHYGHRHLARGFDSLVETAVGPRSAYVPTSTGETVSSQTGRASFYSGRNHTASGGYVGAATCAHRTLPFGTRVLVTNLANAAQAVLTVNDRGPFVRGRIVDVSVGAAGRLGMLHSGTANVRVDVLGAHG